MSTDTEWIVGTGVAVIASLVGPAVAVITVAITLVGGVREDVRRGCPRRSGKSVATPRPAGCGISRVLNNRREKPPMKKPYKVILISSSIRSASR